MLSSGLALVAVAFCLLLLAPAGALAATLITSFSAGVLVHENLARPLGSYVLEATPTAGGGVRGRTLSARFSIKGP